jgi:phosphatidylglycerol:prolipoprotein diacylglycerol transferase
MHPIIISLGDNIKLHSYGLMLGISFVVAWQLGFRYASRQGYPHKVITATYVLAIVFSLLGARLAYVLSNWTDYQLKNESFFSTSFDGLVAYGGFIGGTLAAWLHLKWRKVDAWGFFDCNAVGLVLGLAITRIGCFLAGCCHGKPTDLPWGVVFPPGCQAAETFPGEGGSVPVHPTQLYESLLGLAILPVAIVLFRRRRFTGQAFLVIMALYAVGRFLLEFFRADPDRGTVIGPLSTSQFIGLALVPFAAVMYALRRKSAPPPPRPQESATKPRSHKESQNRS